MILDRKSKDSWVSVQEPTIGFSTGERHTQITTKKDNKEFYKDAVTDFDYYIKTAVEI